MHVKLIFSEKNVTIVHTFGKLFEQVHGTRESRIVLQSVRAEVGVDVGVVQPEKILCDSTNFKKSDSRVWLVAEVLDVNRMSQAKCTPRK